VTTQAISAYGTQLRLSDGVALAPLAVTGATNAAPIVLTTAAHGIPVGDVTWVTVANVGGNTAANGSWIAQALSATTLELRGSVGTAPYTSGGTMTRRGTFTKIAELVNLTPIGIRFDMVDASSHDGTGWGTSIPTLKHGVDMRVEINLVPDHPTHDATTGLMHLAIGKIRRDWLVVLPDIDKTTIAFAAWVTDHSTVTPVAGVLRSTPVLSIDEMMVWAFT
jgi:hypothetical protein